MLEKLNSQELDLTWDISKLTIYRLLVTILGTFFTCINTSNITFTMVGVVLIGISLLMPTPVTFSQKEIEAMRWRLHKEFLIMQNSQK